MFSTITCLKTYQVRNITDFVFFHRSNNFWRSFSEKNHRAVLTRTRQMLTARLLLLDEFTKSKLFYYLFLNVCFRSERSKNYLKIAIYWFAFFVLLNALKQNEKLSILLLIISFLISSWMFYVERNE